MNEPRWVVDLPSALWGNRRITAILFRGSVGDMDHQQLRCFLRNSLGVERGPGLAVSNNCGSLTQIVDGYGVTGRANAVELQIAGTCRRLNRPGSQYRPAQDELSGIDLLPEQQEYVPTPVEAL